MNLIISKTGIELYIPSYGTFGYNLFVKECQEVDLSRRRRIFDGQNKKKSCNLIPKIFLFSSIKALMYNMSNCFNLQFFLLTNRKLSSIFILNSARNENSRKSNKM